MIQIKFKKAFLAMSSLALLVGGVQCSLQNPVAPAWETDINIPLIQNSTYISDFESANYVGKGDSVVTIVLNKTRFTGGIIKTDVSSINGMITSGVINYNLNNRLAIGIDSAMIFISRDSGTVYQDPEIVLGPIRVDAAETDSNGIVVNISTTDISIVLGENETQIMSNSSGTLFIGYYLVTSGTHGETVTIQPTDCLKTSVIVALRTKIN